MDVESVERSFGELLASLGDLVVARTRGEPAVPASGSMRALARRYRARRRAFDRALAGVGGSAAGDDGRAIANMRGALEWLDDLEPTPGLPRVGGGVVSEEPAIARARAALYRRYGEATAGSRVEGETVDRLTILTRLATEPDGTARRSLFEALSPIWRVVDGDGDDHSPYRRLLRSSARRWDRDGSPVEAAAAALGLPHGSLEGNLHAILAAWRVVLGPVRLEPWDYWHAVGAASRRLDRLVPVDRLVTLDHAYLSSLVSTILAPLEPYRNT